MVCDLSNKITLVGDWDLDILSSPMQPKVPTVMYVDPLIPIAPAREMVVEAPTMSLCRGECFLEDTIKLFLNRLTIKREKRSLGTTNNAFVDEAAVEG